MQLIDDERQVTAVISQLVRPGREQGYEEWLKGISAAAAQFPGHQGVSIIRPKNTELEYVIILRFDRYSNLKNWMESDLRREWIERSRSLIVQAQDVQFLTGLETWFTLPDKPLKPAPPGYKMVVVTWLGVQLITILISYFLAPSLSKLPLLLNLSISNALVVVFLTYIVMPQLTRLFYRWLYPGSSSHR
jgi:antibiotic biosynthesis monooxygenase (ABM) superfamily enzyme